MPSIDTHTRRLTRRLGVPLKVLTPRRFDRSDFDAADDRRRGLPDATALGAAVTDIRRYTVQHLEACLADCLRSNGRVRIVSDVDAARRLIADRPVTASPQVHIPGAAVAAVFIAADTGRVCLAGGDAASLASDVVVAGIEAVVPRSSDLVPVLKLLARHGTGRPAMPVVRFIDGDDRPDLILVDGGRSRLSTGPHAELLRCIGCGRCASVCPVVTGISSPIDLAMSAAIGRRAAELPFASTLCGACGDVCPVGIDLPGRLRSLRDPSTDRLTMRLRHAYWAWAIASPARFRWAMRFKRWLNSSSPLLGPMSRKAFRSET